MGRTARTLSDLWRISALVHREAMFQSLYVLKRGGQLTQTQSPGQFKRAMVTSTWVMKGLVCLFLAGTSVGAAFAAAKASFPGVSPAVAMAVAAGMFIFAVLLIIAVMALDMVTGFVSAKAVQAMAHLPLTRRELAITSLLGFVRIFDAPLVTGLATFGISHLILTHSLAGALAYLVGVATAEAFAVVLALALAELFYAKVINQTGSGLKSIARVVYLIFSIMPGISMFLVFSYQAQVGRAILGALATNPKLVGVVQLVYPMSFGFLVASATGSPGATGGMLAVSGLASAVYAGLAVLSLAWAASRLRARALGGSVGVVRQGTKPKDFKVKPVAPWLGVVIKDMRLVFRSPSEAALLLMPAAAVVPWAVAMGSSGRLAVSAPGLVAFVGFMAVTAVPALFNVEAVGQAYIRTLPVKSRWTLGAKAAVATTTYIVSFIVLLAVAALAGRAETRALVPFGGAGVFPAAAGSLVAGSVLSWRSGRAGGGGGGGGARVSPFMSSGGYLRALAAGDLMVAVPYIAASIGSAVFGFAYLPAYFIVGLLEFALVAATVLSERSAS